MILAWLLAVPAILLLAATTHRQSHALFGRGPRPAWRVGGWLLLLASAVAILAGDDRGRGLIGWICGCGLTAAVAATVIGLAAPAKRRRPEKKLRRQSQRSQVREGAATKGVAATATE